MPSQPRSQHRLPLERDRQLEAKDAENLTNWRRDLRRGDEVLYKTKGGNRTKLANITDVQGRGCGISFKGENGGAFAYWTDIFPSNQDPTPASALPPKGSATLGEDLKTKGVDLRVVLPPPPPTRPALTSLPSMVKQVRTEDVPKGSVSLGVMKIKADSPALPEAPPEPPARAVKRPEGRVAHELTSIAIALRTERIRRGHSQRDASAVLGFTPSRLSKLELGVDESSDEVLLSYVDHYKMDLDTLLLLRDGQTENATAEQPKVEAAALSVFTLGDALKALAPTDPPTIPETKGEDQLAWFLEFLDFTERLKLAIPFPADAAKRRSWYKAAQQMFEIHNAQ